MTRGKKSKNSRIGDGKANICRECGKPSKPVLIDGGKKRLVLYLHEKV